MCTRRKSAVSEHRTRYDTANETTVRLQYHRTPQLSRNLAGKRKFAAIKCFCSVICKICVLKFLHIMRLHNIRVRYITPLFLPLNVNTICSVKNLKQAVTLTMFFVLRFCSRCLFCRLNDVIVAKSCTCPYYLHR